MARNRNWVIVAILSAVAVTTAFLFLVGGTIVDTYAGKSRAQIRMIHSVLSEYRKDNGRFPEMLADLTTESIETGGPYTHLRMIIDPWGRSFYYQPGKDGQSFALFSLGSDGRLGGTGPAEDIAVYFPEDPSAP